MPLSPNSIAHENLNRITNRINSICLSLLNICPLFPIFHDRNLFLKIPPHCLHTNSLVVRLLLSSVNGLNGLNSLKTINSLYSGYH